ncbi:enoyl-CoA delta isomerase 2, peroxisomal-like isoform X2 [Durio zibethinus]|uniref:Delta(3)-Delta(2)-enoyl-CoA isomerase n=1 Tax=Durio zibethinus TaxID=66656 RepID=A0A6P6A647_DURZI|nr:enoyl-CoA delta isomerase 2, peroxisomal-like isoform X1 [Durio zibethinus]XP_022760245.1 enoyl-CoA delta isomerase 2, peroxisomal-like isoform X2 [Durio zibethinus]
MCTLEKRGGLFILTLTGDDQHRLNPTLISSILSALSKAKAQSTSGSALITTAQGRFFSNGFDLGWAQSAGSKKGAQERLSQLVELLKPVVAALINLPMPTFAAITGHAAAAGFILALSHDYVIMRRDRGVLYMPEVDIGLTIPDYFDALFRGKIGAASTRRNMLLRGLKMKGDEAEKRGIVEAAYDSEGEVQEASVRMAEDLAKRKWDGDVYAEIRKGLYPELCAKLGLTTKAYATPRL